MASRVFNVFSLSRTLDPETKDTKDANSYLSFLSEKWNETKNLFVEEDCVNNRVISYVSTCDQPDCDSILSHFDKQGSRLKYVIFEHQFCGETVTNVVCQSSLFKIGTPIPGFKQLNGVIIPNKDSQLVAVSDTQNGIPSHSLLNVTVDINSKKDSVVVTNCEDSSSSSFCYSVIREFLAFSPNRFAGTDRNILTVILCEHLDPNVIDENYSIIVSAVYNDVKSIVHVNKSAGDIRSTVKGVIDKIMNNHEIHHTMARFNRAYALQKDKTFRSVGELFRTFDSDTYTTWHKQYLIEHINEAIAQCKDHGKVIRQETLSKIYAPIVKAYLFLDFVYIGNDLYHKSRWSHFLRPVGIKNLLSSLRTITALIGPQDLESAQAYAMFVDHINHLKYSEGDAFLKSYFSHEYEDAEALLNETRGIMAWEDSVTEVIEEVQQDGRRMLDLRTRAGRIEDFVTFKCGTGLGYNIDTGEIEVDDAEETENLMGIRDFLRKMFVDRETRRSVKRMLGASLIGDNLSKIVAFLDGIGGNGKTALLDLVKCTLGDYYVVISPSILMVGSQKKDAANAAPDILKLKGRRFAVVMEPSPHIMFDPGALKSKSSRDDDKARPLYGKTDVAFKAMYTIWIACNNPTKIDNPDMQALRRCWIIPAKTRFVDEGYSTDIKQQFEDRIFPADLNFNTYIGRWKSTFGRLLVKWCKKYMADGNNFRFSEEIIKATDFYRHSNSEMMTFTRTCIEQCEGEEIPYTTLLSHYNISTVRLFGTGALNMGKFLSLVKTFVFGKYKKDGVDCNVWDDHNQVLHGYRIVDS